MADRRNRRFIHDEASLRVIYWMDWAAKGAATCVIDDLPMRGPLFSGAVGHRTTLMRLDALIDAAIPTDDGTDKQADKKAIVVLSNVWLAEALCSQRPVLLIVEPDKRKAAVRAGRRAEKLGARLVIVVGGEDLPLSPGLVAAVVVDAVSELQADEARLLLTNLVPYLAPGGAIFALDGTANPEIEARISGSFMAARLTSIGQERPRDGALVTLGHAPLAAPLRQAARG